MVVVKGNFSATAPEKPKVNQADLTERMMNDLGLDNLVVITPGQREPVVAYFNEYNGRRYFHLRTVYCKQGRQWCHGKGLSVDPDLAKEMLSNLGELGHKL